MTIKRTLAKTCTYSLMHLTVAVIVAFALTRDWRVALAVGIVEPVVQTFAFAIHERLWSRAGIEPAGGTGGCAHAVAGRALSRLRPPSLAGGGSQ
jgi:uncharacterized membrane protein